MNSLKNVIRLGLINGYDTRQNEVIYAPPACIAKEKSVVVFFGGDVQNYPEEMTSHRDHGRHLDWNLEAVAGILQGHFKSSYIFVVRPKRMEMKTFSCYENFVVCNKIGSSTLQSMNKAILHLKLLIDGGLIAASSQNLEQCSDETKDCIHEEIGNSPRGIGEIDSFTLIGFSKGCIVLNQIAMEIDSVSSTECPEVEFIKKISSIYWLDGGHSASNDTWITKQSVISSLAAQKHIKIHVHVTPYQVQDECRPWIRKEHKIFVNTLQKLGVNVDYKLHFENEPPSLSLHFQLIKEFMS